MDWEDSQSSTEETTEQNVNLFSDSELFAALKEYQTNSTTIQVDKRRKQSPNGLNSLNLAPKAPHFSLEKGLLILPCASNITEETCLRTLKDTQNLHFPLTMGTMVNTSDASLTVDVISTSTNCLLKKEPFLVLPIKGKLSENTQSSSMAVSNSQSLIDHEDAISSKLASDDDKNQLEASTTEDSDYEPEADLASESASDDERAVSQINLVASESGSVSLDDASNIPFDGDAHKERKRKKLNQGEWKTNKNKKLRMEGETYLGYRRTQQGQIFHDVKRGERRMGPACRSEMCKKSKVRSCNELQEGKRKSLFNAFWKTMTWDQRRTFILNTVEKQHVKRRRNQSGNSRRQASLRYFLNIKESRKQVCCKTYLNTFGIKKWTVRYWMDNNKKEETIAPSSSITHSRTADVASRRRKVDKEFVKTFFDSLPQMPSHYCRQSTTRKYLEPIVTSASQLYNLYLEKCQEENVGKVSRFTFDSVFQEQNLSLFSPRKDQCDLCCAHQAGNLAEEDYVKHIEGKNRARTEKNQDKEKAASNLAHVFTQDLQAVKLAPFTKASAFYYRKKLNVHNFTMYNLQTHKVVCYWFDETATDLLASSFVSCIVHTLCNILQNNRLPVILWSDGCNYQNRNTVLSNALLHLSKEFNVDIEQKFLTKGHTQMECDSVHSAIETKLKNKDIYLPGQYCTLTREARRKPFPYESNFHDYTFFKNYSGKNFMIYDSIRPGRTTGDPTVVDIRAIKYTNGEISIKINFDEEYSPLPRRPKKTADSFFLLANAPPLNKERRTISHSKWKDLQELKTVLTQDCHSFYNEIPHDGHN